MTISALAEGPSIRSIERMTGVHRDTVMRLGVGVNAYIGELQDVMRKLHGAEATHVRSVPVNEVCKG